MKPMHTLLAVAIAGVFASAGTFAQSTAAQNAGAVAQDKAQLKADHHVVSVTYVSKEEALARAQHRPGLPELADAAESNPFPASLDVQLKSIDDVAAIDASVRDELVVDPTYPTSYDDRFGFNGGPRCQPISDGEFVYTFGAEGKLHCIKLTTGHSVTLIVQGIQGRAPPPAPAPEPSKQDDEPKKDGPS